MTLTNNPVVNYFKNWFAKVEPVQPVQPVEPVKEEPTLSQEPAPKAKKVGRPPAVKTAVKKTAPKKK
jgi:hypothetical protein